LFIGLVNSLVLELSQLKVGDCISGPTAVKSGVPQGSVLGPLLFSIFINDLQIGLNSTVRLFADDCALSSEIKSAMDCIMLQSDLVRVLEWCKLNGMVLNVQKCQVISFTNKRSSFCFDYTLDGVSFERTNSATYLGVTFDSKLEMRDHINDICKKANKALYFIRRAFARSTKEIKEKAYFSLVRSRLEYSSSCWDPHLACQVTALEAVQRKAARFVLGDFNFMSSPTSMIQTLGWNTLADRRKYARLKNFHSVYQSHGGWKDIRDYFDHSSRETRAHSCKVVVRTPSTDFGKFSFISRTAAEWNKLPAELFLKSGQPQSFGLFKGGLKKIVLGL